MGLCLNTKNTFFKEIKQVMPGTILKFSVKKNEIKETQLKTNLDKILLDENEDFNANQHKSEIDKVLTDHLVADANIMSTISGGLDSSYISINASQKMNRKITTLTLNCEFIKLDKSL